MLVNCTAEKVEILILMSVNADGGQSTSQEAQSRSKEVLTSESESFGAYSERRKLCWSQNMSEKMELARKIRVRSYLCRERPVVGLTHESSLPASRRQKLWFCITHLQLNLFKMGWRISLLRISTLCQIYKWIEEYKTMICIYLKKPWVYFFFPSAEIAYF